jgi:hypothetical protein
MSEHKDPHRTDGIKKTPLVAQRLLLLQGYSRAQGVALQRDAQQRKHPCLLRFRPRLVMAGDPAAGRLRRYPGCKPHLTGPRRFALEHTTLLSIVPAATARRHHPNPAEAHRRWRGKRSKPVRLGVRHRHTRSLYAQSPAQSKQWGCWFCRGRNRGNSCLTAMPLDGSRRRKTLAEIRAR